MGLIPIFKIWNIVSYNSVDKEEIKLIMICVRTQLFTIDYCRIAHPGDNSKSGLPIVDWSPVLMNQSISRISIPVHYFFCLKNCVKSLQEELK